MVSINLTTTSSRLDLCSATIWSLVHQSILPDCINLWISSSPYLADNGIEILPDWVEEINSFTDLLRVRYVDNTGPYRKIIPALMEASNEDTLVYVDDDVIYGRDWLKYLLQCFFENNEKYVVASRIRIMKKNFLKKYQSYNMFPILRKNIIIDSDYIITGVGGCVLKRRMIQEKFLLNNDFIKIAPKTDDLWISKILTSSGTPVFSCVGALGQVHEIAHENNSLSLVNTTANIKGSLLNRFFRKLINKVLGYFGISITNNDRSLKRINEYFG